MKKQIPKFKSLEAERKFWDTHSMTEYLDELTPVKVKFSRPKKKLISLRLDVPLIESVKAVAARRHLGYLSLLRSWISERLSKEHRTHTHYRPTH